MGIESDQLVYDYLSRVGDVAQQRQLPSGERMRLVSELRGEIEKQRGRFGGDSPAAVRRILGRLGTPDQVVGAAAGEPGSGPRPSAPEARPEPPSLPKQRGRRGLGLGRGGSLPKQTRRSVPEAPAEPAAAPPHLAPMREAGSSGGEPDWWRVDPGAMDTTGVSGFVGGVEIPEILKPPPTPEELAEKEKAEAEADEEEVAEPPERRRLLPRLRRRAEKPPPAETRAGFRLTNPFLLLAAALLVLGAVVPSWWLVLALGWALAYTSRRLSPIEAKLAVFGLPIASAVGGGVWIWGRMTERWGESVPEGATGEAISATWPTVLQVAAISSALFLVWRSRRV